MCFKHNVENKENVVFLHFQLSSLLHKSEIDSTSVTTVLMSSSYSTVSLMFSHFTFSSSFTLISLTSLISVPFCQVQKHSNTLTLLFLQNLQDNMVTKGYTENLYVSCNFSPNHKPHIEISICLVVFIFEVFPNSRYATPSRSKSLTRI